MSASRWVLALALLASAADASALQAQRGRTAPAEPTQLVPWPIKTREHVDLWLHGYALLQEDTATVPIFVRDYRQATTIAKNSRRVYSAFDSVQVELSERLQRRGDLIGGQFLALYFGSWEDLVQATEYFLRAEGDPSKARGREVQALVALIAEYFPRADDREFLRKFVHGLSDERRLYFREWWVAQEAMRRDGLVRADSLWQSTWRPALQRFLNHTQQQGGDLIVSTVLAGEGRALPAGKTTNQYAVTWPATADSADVLLFAFAHEVIGSTAQAAVNDNLTPAETRSGLATKYQYAGVVRGGALLVEQVQPGLGLRYARWYLALSGAAVPADDAAVMTMFEEKFPMRPEMIESMQRQIAIAFTGI